MKLSLAFFMLLFFFSCASTRFNSHAITGKYWKLVELNGKAVDTQSQREPFIIFSVLDSRISGNSGCNNFFGNYTTGAGNQIAIGQIGATKMACPDMSVEQQLFTALPLVKFYSAENNQLMLKNTDQVVLAKFTWDEKK